MKKDKLPFKPDEFLGAEGCFDAIRLPANRVVELGSRVEI